MIFRRFTASYFVGLVSFILVSSAAYAIEPLDARQYVSTRKQCSAALSGDGFKAEPTEHIGKHFEVRGRICGIMGGNEDKYLIITGRDGSSYQVYAGDFPEDIPGTEVACIVKIGEDSQYSLTDLHMTAWTYGIDLTRLEEAWQRNAEAKAAREKQAQEDFSEKTTRTTGEKTDVTEPTTSAEMIKIYTNAVKGFNPKLSQKEAETIARSVLGFSFQYKVDPRLVCAVILAESHFKPGATSCAGAQGLGQLMPGTAAGLGVSNAYDPVENVYGSVRYIKSMLDRMSGNKKWNELTWQDLGKALAAYNAGPGAVKKYGGIPPYRETQNYVRKVTSIYKQLCGIK